MSDVPAPVKENVLPNNSPKKRKLSATDLTHNTDPRECSFCKLGNSAILPRCEFKKCGEPTCFVCGGRCEDCGAVCCSEHYVGVDPLAAHRAVNPDMKTPVTDIWLCKTCLAVHLCGCDDSALCFKCCERHGTTLERCARNCNTGGGGARVACHRTCVSCQSWRCSGDMLMCRDCNVAVCRQLKCSVTGKKRDNDYWCHNCYSELV